MNNYLLGKRDLSDLFDLQKPPYKFSDRKPIPKTGSIIYTVWNEKKEFIYVGISGIQKKPVEQRNPHSRIKAHSSGRRSGNQFCIYVHDVFVIPKVIQEEKYEYKRGNLDKLTKKYIDEYLRYRFMSFQTKDSIDIVRTLEEKIKKGDVKDVGKPLFNGTKAKDKPY